MFPALGYISRGKFNFPFLWLELSSHRNHWRWPHWGPVSSLVSISGESLHMRLSAPASLGQSEARRAGISQWEAGAEAHAFKSEVCCVGVPTHAEKFDVWPSDPRNLPPVKYLDSIKFFSCKNIYLSTQEQAQNIYIIPNSRFWFLLLKPPTEF